MTEYCDEHVSLFVCLIVCLSVFVCPPSYLRNYMPNLHQIFVHVTYGRGSVNFWQCCDTLCTSGFMDDIIFADKLKATNMRREKAYIQSDSTGGSES